MESWLEVDRAGEIINGVHTALSWHGPPCYLCIEILWYGKRRVGELNGKLAYIS